MIEWLAAAKAWVLTRPDPNAVAFEVSGFIVTRPELFMAVLIICAAIPPLFMFYTQYLKGQKMLQVVVSLLTFFAAIGLVTLVLWLFAYTEPKPQGREDQIQITRHL